MAINKKIFDTLIKKASESGIQAISCSYNQTKNQSLEFTNAKIDGTDISVNNSFSFKALVNDKIRSIDDIIYIIRVRIIHKVAQYLVSRLDSFYFGVRNIVLVFLA